MCVRMCANVRDTFNKGLHSELPAFVDLSGVEGSGHTDLLFPGTSLRNLDHNGQLQPL